MSLYYGSLCSSFLKNGSILKLQPPSNKLIPNSSNSRIYAMSNDGQTTYKMKLNEYMVTLEKPLGIRLALSLHGNVFVHALRKGGNADKSRIVMVGDTLKKATDSSATRFIDINHIIDAQDMLKERSGSFSLVLERPFSPFPIQELFLKDDLDILFNRGRVPIATWGNPLKASSLQSSSECFGNSGFVVFSSKFLAPNAWKMLTGQNGNGHAVPQINSFPSTVSQLVSICTEEGSTDAEWAHGSFPLEEYTKALERSKGEIFYNHSLGMQHSKVRHSYCFSFANFYVSMSLCPYFYRFYLLIPASVLFYVHTPEHKQITEQIFVGSCIQKGTDVEALASMGVTAVLNFQSLVEAENWGINSTSIKESCQRCNILMINYPIREGDSFDMRKKLPFSVGLLLRLLKKNHRVFVTCTTGFDRSPACVIAYLHWMTDTSLNAAFNFVTGLHSCRPNRAAIAWATWDLIAMIEKGSHDGPPTHAVTFVWNGVEGEDVCLVGDFTGNWKEPIKAIYKGGPRYEVEVRLTQGKYYYKYIVNGQWKHSTASPTERDDRGNVNNIIEIGDVASVRPSVRQQKKDANILKVIERQLTENERFTLAKAARCIAFSICPIRLAPK
ncbi:hypothetical protein KSS87_011724 [Heliosperma pusillum]|nr:hypothetical protein KSS87_011724 [Heliosperma pusillum]